GCVRAGRAARARARGAPARARAARACGPERARSPTREPGRERRHRLRLLADHDTAAAAARIAGGRLRPVRQHLDGVRTAEVEVPPPPAHDVVTHLLE